MDLNRGGVSVGQQVSEASGLATPEKSTTMKRAAISVINGQGVTAFESLVDVPVSALHSLSGKSENNLPNRSITPSFAPLTPGNGKSIHHRKPQQAVHLISEDLNGKGSMQEFYKLPTAPIRQRMDLCAGNGCSNLVAPPTPHKAVHSQHASLSPEGVSMQCSESDSGQDEEEQGIDLNKTPRKKIIRRKKHRPKVIKEGTPMKSRRPVTPKTVENNEKLMPKRTNVRKKRALNSSASSPGITEENKEKPTIVKTYVRKRKALHLNSSEFPSVRIGEISAPCSSTNVQSIDQLHVDETKLVRRSLNFSSKDETISRCNVTTNSDVEPVPWKTLRGGAAVCNTEFKVELTQGLEVVVSKSPAGIAFDLNRSLNQVLDEYIRLPESLDPTPSTHSSRRETIWEHLKYSDRTKDAENNMDMRNDHDKINPSSHPDIILIDDDIEKSGAKENDDYNTALPDCSAKSPGDVCSLHDDTKQTSLLHRISGQSPYIPMIYKKKRTERLYTIGDENAVLPKVPIPSTHSSSRETIMEHLKCSDSTKDAENNMDMLSDHDRINPSSHPDIILIDDDIKNSGTKNYDHNTALPGCSAKSPRDVCFLHDDTKETSLFDRFSGLSPYLPVIYKKRRTERVNTIGDEKVVLPKVPRCFTFADAQWTTTPISPLHQPELTKSFDPTHRPTRKRSKLVTGTRKRSKLATHSGKPTLMACVYDHSHLLGSTGNRNCMPPSCMDTLVADTRFKITKRPRKKGHFRLVSSVLSSMNQECQISTRKYCFLGQPYVLALAASHWKNLNQLQYPNLQDFHSRSSNIQRSCQFPKNIQRSFHANFQPEAVVPYIDPCTDPVELFIERMKHMRICGDQLRLTDEATNALIPYAGSSTMVSYGSFPNTIKKQRPRAKVDLDPETNRVWNLLMGKKNNVEAEGVDRDKVKWWEEEREVFRGRADAFIARMHLILGDRRFSMWKGSVVDSVVGVFLTQNVSDHLSSSAFMSLAARFPLRSRGNGKKSNVENMDTSKEHDGIIMQTDTIKWQENTLIPEAIFPTSTVPYGKGKEADDFSSSFGYDKQINPDYCECNCLQFLGREPHIGTELPQNWMQTPASETGILTSGESESRMTLEDVFLTQSSFSLLKDSSEYHNQTAGQAALCSGAATLVKDLVMRRKYGNSDSPTSFMNHSGVRDTSISRESYDNGDVGMLSAEDMAAGNQEVACKKIEQRTSLSEKLCGPESARPSANTPNFLSNHQQNDFEDVPPAPFMSHLIWNSLNARPIGTGYTDIDRAVGSFLPSASHEITDTYDTNLIEGSGTDRGTLLKSMAMMVDKSHVSKGLPCVHMPSCSETQQCPEKHVGCHDSLPSKKIEKLSRNIPYELSHVHDGQLVEVQHEDTDKDFPAGKAHQEVDIPTEIPNRGEQIEYHSSCNDSKVTLENEKAVQLNQKNERCSFQDLQPERGDSASRLKKIDAETEKMFDWEDLRKEAFANGAKNERTSDTMDSLDWDAVRNADVNEIANTIRERGMNNVLAQRIKDFLNRLVKDHGSIDLEWLRNVPPDKVKDYLLSIRGLGLKSVECVRLLTLHHLAFPVDTNVGRICVRLGWVPLQPLPESLQLHLLELYPMLEHIQKYLWPRLCTLDQRTLYELHYQMITFGKVFCTKTKPNCNACPMRGECKHFASAFASARFALPGPEEKRLVTSRSPSATESDRSQDFGLIPPCQLEGIQPIGGNANIACEPIIEEPASPEHQCTQELERDIEDAFYEDPEEIPTINLCSEEFKKNLKHYMQENNLEIQDSDMSKALVAITAEAASIPMPKLKNVNRLRTEHQVYELPDSHPLLKGMDCRIPDDPCPYLLAIWTPGETAQSTEPPQSCCNPQDSAKLCDMKTCFACNSIREAQAQTIRGTILIPCRTAMKGSFPLNGTYFQVNEVFADHSSSRMPIEVPRKWVWNLPRRTVFFGSSIPTIFKGLTMEGIQHCFWRGFVCVRGFDRASRAPRPLYARLHLPASKAVQNKKAAGKEHGFSTPPTA